MPSANANWMGLALAEFARWADPEGRKLLMDLVDKAGYESGKAPASAKLTHRPAGRRSRGSATSLRGRPPACRP